MTRPKDALETARSAAEASYRMKALVAADRDSALKALYECLIVGTDSILLANKEDMVRAEGEVEAGRMSDSLLQRLDLSHSCKMQQMIQGVKDIIDLEDPVDQISFSKKLHDQLDLYRVTTPLGVILVIFESRPEVFINITALAIKSGNCVILKGGKEASSSLKAMAKVVTEALGGSKVPANAVQLVLRRDDVKALLACDSDIDLVIPRGGNALVRFVKDNTKIPVMGHADGICSVYIHEGASLDRALAVVEDSKLNYPAACNAAETLLLDRAVVASFLPNIAMVLWQFGTKLLCDQESFKILERHASPGAIEPASVCDFETEFLDRRIAVKVVEDVNDAIMHINKHSSHHTDSIVTENSDIAAQFLKRVDSACVFWNASTRFADGFRFGFGSELGISTNKLHARGPVGLDGMVTYKYVLRGDGHSVADFQTGQRRFWHTK